LNNQNIFEIKEQSRRRRMKVGFHLSPTVKVNLRRIRGLSIIPETIIVMEESTWECFRALE
jgi:hypothetical protein